MRWLRGNSLGMVLFTVVAVATGIGAENESPPSIAALVGEWSGESRHSVWGTTAAESHRDARQYWLEGEIVRGEILSGAGGSLELYEVTIVPRNGRFLKILQSENDERELFVGIGAEGGVMWSALDADGVLFLERVVGTGSDRKLEILMPDNGGGSWQIAEALQPAEGVIGGSSRAVGQVKPLILPPVEELELVDRIAQLLEQRDTARKNGDSLARELANAWRMGEEAAARVRELEQQIEGSTAGDIPASSEEAEPAPRLATAQKEAEEARLWAEQLEQSLEATHQRVEEETARSAAMEKELAAARDALNRAREENAELNTALAQERANAGRATAPVEELEAVQAALENARAEGEELRAARAVAASGLAESQEQNEALSTRLRELQEQFGASERERETLESELAAAQERLVAAESLPDELKQQAEQIATQEQRIAELQTQIQSTEAARTDAEKDHQSLAASITALEKENAGLRERADGLESQAREASTWSAAELAQMHSVQNELETAKAAAESVTVQLRDEVETLTVNNNEWQATIQSLNEAAERDRALLAERNQRIAELTGALDAAQKEAVALAAEMKAASPQVSESDSSRPSDDSTTTADVRIAQLETRLADTFARSDQRQSEIERLTKRVSELESERQVLRDRVIELAAQTPVPSELSSSESIEVADLPVVAAGPAPAQVVARGPPQMEQPAAGRAAPVASPSPILPPNRAPRIIAAAPTQPTLPAPESVPAAPANSAMPLAAVQFRLPPSSPSSGARVPPTRPSEAMKSSLSSAPSPAAPTRSPAGVNSFLAQVVRSLSINGYRGRGTQGTIVIAGRLYQSGESIVDGRGLQFTRIDPDAIIFTDTSGGEYRYSL